MENPAKNNFLFFPKIVFRFGSSKSLTALLITEITSRSKITNRFVGTSQIIVCNTTISISYRIFGVYSYCFIIILDCPIILTFFAISDPTIAVSNNVVRVKCDCLIIILYRIIILTLVVICNASGYIVYSYIWIQPDGFSNIIYGLVIQSLFAISNSTTGISHRIFLV